MKYSQILSFIISIEKLKTVMRHSYTSNKKRQESSAEHSWLMGMIALSIFDYLNEPVDELRVLKLVLFHDLAEIITDDIPAFEISRRQEEKHESERSALYTLLKPLPKKQQLSFLSLWEEFEENSTQEAKVAQAIDKIEVLIQHNLASIETWDQGDFDIQPFYRDNLFDFDAFLRKLKDEVEHMSYEKISQSGNMTRIKPTAAEKYKKLYKKKSI